MIRKLISVWKRLPLLYLGWACIFSLLLTIKWTYVGDGPSLYGYGLPFPWLKFSLVSSLQWDVHVLHLALNILVFMVPISILGDFLEVRSWVSGILGVPYAHIIGTIMVGLTLLFISMHGYYYHFQNPLFDKSWKLQRIDIHYGLSRDYFPDKTHNQGKSSGRE